MASPREIFHVLTSTEYWARYGSLVHTSVDGTEDLGLASESRLYFIAGVPHAGGDVFPLSRVVDEEHYENPVAPGMPKAWVFRALLEALDGWVARNVEPPPSAYPHIADGTLVRHERVRWPAVTGFATPAWMPGVWRVSDGTATDRREPPRLGTEYTALVPDVDSDGNERAGIRHYHVAVPLGTWTGWNVSVPAHPELRYLGGLRGSLLPFAPTREAREAASDGRPSIAERYAGREDYRSRVLSVTNNLAARRYVREADVAVIEREALEFWDGLVGNPTAR
jgi:hypothetical protein